MPAAEGRMAQNPDEYWVFKQSLTPAVSRAARSEASGGHQPGTGWRRLDQPVRLRREVK